MAKETLHFSLPAALWQQCLLLIPAKFMVFDMTLNLREELQVLGYISALQQMSVSRSEEN